MTSASLVILTEPANCALADGQLLLQAVLEAQLLSREGVPVSQAFCDNPAAAESFIEAYARAFPELQRQSADLPLPEQLYSMMVDGRLAALPGLDQALDRPNPEGAVTFQPLIVLSMGAPDALMQALQGNSFANHQINLVEIPPVEHGSASVTVAAAVAANALTGTSPGPDASPASRFREDQDGSLAPSEGLSDAPLKLESAELDLDILESDGRDEPQPAAAIVHAAAALAAAGGLSTSPGVPRPVQADARAADGSNVGSPASQPDAVADAETRNPAAAPPTSAHPAVVAPAAVVPETPEPVVVPDPTPPPGETGDAEQGTPPDPPLGAGPAIEPPSSAGDAEAPRPAPPPVENADAEEGTPAGPPLGAGPAIEPPSSAGDSETATPTPIGSGADAGLPDAEQVSEGPRETAAPSASGDADEDTTEPVEDAADNGSSFSDPGEDVVYPPTGSFTSDDELPYPLPLAAASEADGLGAILRMSLADEIVDFEAMSSSADRAMLTAEPFDPIMTRAGGPDGLDQQGVHGWPQDADPGHREKPTPHHDTHQDETVTPVHDLDL